MAQDDGIDGTVGQTLEGGTHGDILEGGQGNDRIDGGGGMDLLLGGDGNDTIYGGDGNDLVDGNAGDDIIYGESGNDTMNGGDGNDIISGGTGNDMLWGNFCGEGDADTFVFESSNNGNDTIGDFEVDLDTIDLSLIESITGWNSLSMTQQGDDVVIDLTDHGGGSITLSGIDINDLDADDFNFFTSADLEVPVDGM